MSRNLLLNRTYECKCIECESKFDKTFSENDFLKEQDYVDSLEHDDVKKGSKEWKKRIEEYLGLEEYYMECPVCKNTESVGTYLPQWFKIKEKSS